MQGIAPAEATCARAGAQRGRLDTAGRPRIPSTRTRRPFPRALRPVKLRIAVAAASLALAACSGGEKPGGITREQFIRANTALRAVSDSAPDVDSLRARALRSEKVTAAQLRAWLQAHLDDPVLLAETWSEIARRADASDPARQAAKAAPHVGPPLTHGPPPEIQPAPLPAPPPVQRPVPPPATQPAPPVLTPTPAPQPATPPPPTSGAPADERPRPKKPPTRDTVPAPRRDSATARPDSAAG